MICSRQLLFPPVTRPTPTNLFNDLILCICTKCVFFQCRHCVGCISVELWWQWVVTRWDVFTVTFTRHALLSVGCYTCNSSVWCKSVCAHFRWEGNLNGLILFWSHVSDAGRTLTCRCGTHLGQDGQLAWSRSGQLTSEYNASSICRCCATFAWCASRPSRCTTSTSIGFDVLGAVMELIRVLGTDVSFRSLRKQSQLIWSSCSEARRSAEDCIDLARHRQSLVVHAEF